MQPDIREALVLLVAVGGYFIYASAIRTQTFDPIVISSSFLRTFMFFMLTFMTTVGFMWLIGRILRTFSMSEPVSFLVALVLSAYSLVPTLIWFLITSMLYLLFPPPRYDTFLGNALSMIFIVVSTSILIWRLILWYLTIRFSLRVQFMTIMVIMFIFVLWLVPYAFLMYYFRVFRIPFI